MKSLVLFTLLLFPVVILTHNLHADDQQPTAAAIEPDQAPEVSQHKPVHWSVSISPRYYAMYDGNNVTTFGNPGGLNSPKTNWYGLEVVGYLTLQGGWQLGLGLGGMGYESDNAINDATYSQGYFGGWLGKDFQLSDQLDAAIGTLLSYGVAQTGLISLGSSGRTTEDSFMFEPKLTVAWRFAPLFKVGVSGSYMSPMFQRQKIRGNNLTNNANISVRGPSAGVEFVVGR